MSSHCEAVQCTISHVLFKNVQRRLFFNSFSHLPACIGQSEHIFATVEFELVSVVDYRNDMEERKTNRQQTSILNLTFHSFVAWAEGKNTDHVT